MNMSINQPNSSIHDYNPEKSVYDKRWYGCNHYLTLCRSVPQGNYTHEEVQAVLEKAVSNRREKELLLIEEKLKELY